MYIVMLTIIINGNNFCKVDNRNKTHKEHLFKIEINQPWKGAAPSFKTKATNFIKTNLFLIIKEKIIPKRNIIDAHLWIIKYFIVFSKDIPGSDDITGKNANIFISKHNHIIKEDPDLNKSIIDISKIK